MYKYLLFDLDGTLFDIKKVEIVVLKQVLEQNFLTYTENIVDSYTKINEDLWKEFELGNLTKSEVRLKRFEILIEKHFPHSSIDIQKIANDYFQLFSKTVIAFEGTQELLESLKKNYKLYVISNGSIDVQYYKLNKLGFSKYFDRIFLSEEIGYAKPNVKFFEYVYYSLQMPQKDSILVIGDSITADIIGGSNYGFDTCYVGKEECTISTYSITDIVDLTEIIKKQQ